MILAVRAAGQAKADYTGGAPEQQEKLDDFVPNSEQAALAMSQNS